MKDLRPVPSRTLIFIPDRNSPNKSDMTGAFLPEALAFAKHHQVPESQIIRVPVAGAHTSREEFVIQAIEKHFAQSSAEPCTIAFFAHGHRYHSQFGFGERFAVNQKALRRLAKIIRSKNTGEVIFPLYACTSATSDRTKNDQVAAGDGGFADELRDALCREGATECRVIGHTTAGHTTRNPYVRFFEGSGATNGGEGGHWVVRPNGPMWKKWVAVLKTDLRYDFCFMGLASIHAKLV